MSNTNRTDQPAARPPLWDRLSAPPADGEPVGPRASTVLFVLGVAALVASAIAFVVVQAGARRLETDPTTGQEVGVRTPFDVSGNYTLSIVLAIVGAVLVTWGLLARRPS